MVLFKLKTTICLFYTLFEFVVAVYMSIVSNIYNSITSLDTNTLANKSSFKLFTKLL